MFPALRSNGLTKIAGMSPWNMLLISSQQISKDGECMSQINVWNEEMVCLWYHSINHVALFPKYVDFAPHSNTASWISGVKLSNRGCTGFRQSDMAMDTPISWWHTMRYSSVKSHFFEIPPPVHIRQTPPISHGFLRMLYIFRIMEDGCWILAPFCVHCELPHESPRDEDSKLHPDHVF